MRIARLLPHRARRLCLAGALLVTAPALLPAQLRTTRVVALDGAQRALVAALAEARRQEWQVAIAVVDAAGDLVAFARMDGAQPASIEVATGKARTAARFRRPTRALDSSAVAGRVVILGLPGATPVEGGVPIVVDGEIVGAIGVSGATSAQDAQVARAGLAAIAPR